MTEKKTLKKGFSIPKQSEVAIYMKEKKGWPQKFCEYMAERFWNFYQSNGWKVSGRAAMKDWKAAFCSQWQTLKHKEDFDYLNKCTEKLVMKPGEIKSTVGYMDELLLSYAARYDSVPVERLASCYDWMKEQKLIKLTKEEVDRIKEAYGADPLRGKAACVSVVFTKMINNNWTFHDVFKKATA